MRIAHLLPAAALAGLLALSPTARGQDDQQAELKAKLEKKLQEEFLKNATWILDYDQALEQAKESGKLIFAYYSRSYQP